MPNVSEDAQTHRKIRPTIHEDVSLPIYWINEEWAVTRFGLESVAPGSSYWIDAPRLGLKRGDRAEWPAQIESKGWTDPRLFLEAFFQALEIHGVQHDFDRQHEEHHAREAANQIVAWNEVRRRRAKNDGSNGIVTVAEMTRDEEEMEKLLAEGFQAPEFPRSCIER